MGVETDIKQMSLTPCGSPSGKDRHSGICTSRRGSETRWGFQKSEGVIRKGFLEEVTLEVGLKECGGVSRIKIYVKALRA